MVDPGTCDVSMAPPTDRQMLGSVTIQQLTNHWLNQPMGQSCTRSGKTVCASSRVIQRSFAGVIVDFIADETLLAVIAGVLSCLFGIGVLALPQVVQQLSEFGGNLWSPPELSEMTDRTCSRWGVCLSPQRSPVRVAPPGDRSELRSVSPRRGSLGSWQSDNR